MSAQKPPAPSVHTIVLTGGPCAGKTTALDRLSAYLRERGFRVFTVTEAATLMFGSGVYFSDLQTKEASITFQAQLMGIQLCLEDAFINVARATGEPSVVLCDRGACDGKAYTTPEGWEAVKAQRGFDSDVPLREGRYAAVFHLVTAASGAEKFYTLSNNETRTESAEQARVLDEQTQRAWMGHPRLTIFDNEGKNFEAKMRRVVDTMAMIVGLPLVERTPTKFLLASIPAASIPDPQPAKDGLANYLREELIKGGVVQKPAEGSSSTSSADPLQVFEVEKIYILGSLEVGSAGSAAGVLNLESAGESSDGRVLQYSFIRRRSQHANSTYGHTTVSRHPSGERVEVKRIMDAREFEFLKATLADPSRHVVLQRRYCFLWAGKSYSIHRYLEPSKATCILHCQSEWAPKEKTEESNKNGPGALDSAPSSDAAAAASAKEVTFPPFLRVDSPLKSDGEFSAFRLSLKEKPRPDSPALPLKNEE